MAVWDEFLTAQDHEVFPKSGYGRRVGFGRRPAVLVVDVVTAFVGDRREPILESMTRWYNSCGEAGWKAVEEIDKLLEVARDRAIPIVYSRPAEARPDGFDAGRWVDKNARLAEDLLPGTAGGNEVPVRIAPRDSDIVVRSSKPSIFFGTFLLSYLIDLEVDSLLVCGTTTSGCVRATVVDAFSYNYRVSIVEECTFDRGQASHAINLFDMDQKYADVVSSASACAYLLALPSDIFARQMPSIVGASTRSERVG